LASVRQGSFDLFLVKKCSDIVWFEENFVSDDIPVLPIALCSDGTLLTRANWGSRAAVPIYVNLHNQKSGYFRKIVCGYFETFAASDLAEYSHEVGQKLKLHLKHLQLRHLLFELTDSQNTGLLINSLAFWLTKVIILERWFDTPYGLAKFYILLNRYIVDNQEANSLTGVFHSYCSTCALGGASLTDPSVCSIVQPLDLLTLYDIQEHPSK